MHHAKKLLFPCLQVAPFHVNFLEVSPLYQSCGPLTPLPFFYKGPLPFSIYHNHSSASSSENMCRPVTLSQHLPLTTSISIVWNYSGTQLFIYLSICSLCLEGSHILPMEIHLQLELLSRSCTFRKMYNNICSSSIIVLFVQLRLVLYTISCQVRAQFRYRFGKLNILSYISINPSFFPKHNESKQA